MTAMSMYMPMVQEASARWPSAQGSGCAAIAEDTGQRPRWLQMPCRPSCPRADIRPQVDPTQLTALLSDLSFEHGCSYLDADIHLGFGALPSWAPLGVKGWPDGGESLC